MRAILYLNVMNVLLGGTVPYTFVCRIIQKMSKICDVSVVNSSSWDEGEGKARASRFALRPQCPQAVQTAHLENYTYFHYLSFALRHRVEKG